MSTVQIIKPFVTFQITKTFKNHPRRGTVTQFEDQQGKYTMDPGHQICLSNIKKNFGQKWLLNNKIKKLFNFK